MYQHVLEHERICKKQSETIDMLPCVLTGLLVDMIRNKVYVRFIYLMLKDNILHAL